MGEGQVVLFLSLKTWYLSPFMGTGQVTFSGFLNLSLLWQCKLPQHPHASPHPEIPAVGEQATVYFIYALCRVWQQGLHTCTPTPGMQCELPLCKGVGGRSLSPAEVTFASSEQKVAERMGGPGDHSTRDPSLVLDESQTPLWLWESHDVLVLSVSRGMTSLPIFCFPSSRCLISLGHGTFLVLMRARPRWSLLYPSASGRCCGLSHWCCPYNAQQVTSCLMREPKTSKQSTYNRNWILRIPLSCLSLFYSGLRFDSESHKPPYPWTLLFWNIVSEVMDLLLAGKFPVLGEKCLFTLEAN